MNMKVVLALASAVVTWGISTAVAEPKTYQITGPVLAIDDASITIRAKKEKWQFARDASSAPAQPFKVGDTVTLTYSMTTTKIERKEKPAKPEATATDSKGKEASHE